MFEAEHSWSWVPRGLYQCSLPPNVILKMSGFSYPDCNIFSHKWKKQIFKSKLFYNSFQNNWESDLHLFEVTQPTGNLLWAFGAVLIPACILLMLTAAYFLARRCVARSEVEDSEVEAQKTEAVSIEAKPFIRQPQQLQKQQLQRQKQQQQQQKQRFQAKKQPWSNIFSWYYCAFEALALLYSTHFSSV